MNKFNEILKELREEKRLSQDKLAKEINSTSGTISRWEQGIIEPKKSALIKLANFFDVSIDFLVGLEE